MLYFMKICKKWRQKRKIVSLSDTKCEVMLKYFVNIYYFFKQQQIPFYNYFFFVIIYILNNIVFNLLTINLIFQFIVCSLLQWLKSFTFFHVWKLSSDILIHSTIEYYYVINIINKRNIWWMYLYLPWVL